MKAGARRALLEQLLGLHDVGLMTQFLQGYISENKTKLTESTSQQKEIHNSIKTLKTGIDEANARKEAASQDYDQKLTELNTKRDKVNETVSSLIESLPNIELDNIKNTIATVADAMSKLSNVEYELKSREKRTKTELSFLDTHESCPNCKQVITQEHKATMTESYQSDLETIGLKLQTVSSKLIELNSTKKDQTEVVQQHNAITEKIKQYNQALRMIESEIASINDKKNIVVDESNITFLQTQLSDSIQRLDEVTKTITELQKEYELYQSTKDFLSDNGIRRIVVSKYLPFLMSRINYWLEQFEYHAIISIDDDFEETIKVRGFDPTRYSSLSSGEKAKVTISLVLSFRELLELRNNSNIHLLILDEVVENVDASSKIKLFWNLRNIAEKNDTSIFIVSHGVGDNLDPFHKQIHVEKAGNFSKIRNAEL